MSAPEVTPITFPRVPVSTVTPFTYKDGLTYLKVLEGIRESLNETISVVNKNANSISGLEDNIAELLIDLNEKLVAQQKALDDALIVMRQELESMISSSHEIGTLFDPTDGNRAKPADVVMSRVFDNLRYFAYFAPQYDEQELTCLEYEALNLTARKYDLSPDRSDNYSVR